MTTGNEVAAGRIKDQFGPVLKQKLEESRRKEADAAFENGLMDKLTAGMTADIPAAMIENEITEQVNNFTYRLQSQGMNLDLYLQYTGMTQETLRDQYREQAERQVKGRLALEQVAKQEGIVPAEEEIEAEYARLAEQYKMDADRIKTLLPADSVKGDLTLKKALDLVKESAKRD